MVGRNGQGGLAVYTGEGVGLEGQFSDKGTELVVKMYRKKCRRNAGSESIGVIGE